MVPEFVRRLQLLGQRVDFRFGRLQSRLIVTRKLDPIRIDTPHAMGAREVEMGFRPHPNCSVSLATMTKVFFLVLDMIVSLDRGSRERKARPHNPCLVANSGVASARRLRTRGRRSQREVALTRRPACGDTCGCGGPVLGCLARTRAEPLGFDRKNRSRTNFARPRHYNQPGSNDRIKRRSPSK